MGKTTYLVQFPPNADVVATRDVLRHNTIEPAALLCISLFDLPSRDRGWPGQSEACPGVRACETGARCALPRPPDEATERNTEKGSALGLTPRRPSRNGSAATSRRRSSIPRRRHDPS